MLLGSIILAISLIKPNAIQWEDVEAGLQFSLPKEAVAVAFGAFGITGVGGDEIIAYTYWCLEKGYAVKSGPPEDTAAYEGRAKGWMKVMYGGIVGSLILFLVVFAALHFRYKQTPDRFRPNKIYDIIFWVSVLSIGWVGIYGITKLF